MQPPPDHLAQHVIDQHLAALRDLIPCLKLGDKAATESARQFLYKTVVLAPPDGLAYWLAIVIETVKKSEKTNASPT